MRKQNVWRSFNLVNLCVLTIILSLGFFPTYKLFAQDRLAIMQGIFGEIGHSRSNDGFIFRATGAQGQVAPGNTIYIYIVLPSHANNIHESDMYIFPTCSEGGGHWWDIPAGTYSKYKNTSGQWVIQHEFLNGGSVTRTYSLNVLYYLANNDSVTNYSIHTSSSSVKQSQGSGSGSGSGTEERYFYADCVVRKDNYLKAHFLQDLRGSLPKIGEHIQIRCTNICNSSMIEPDETSEIGWMCIIVDVIKFSDATVFKTLIAGTKE
jgi:hypothetical protein